MKRKAQGAIEYLFMIAAALVIVLIVWRQISGRGSSASEIADTAEDKISSELQQEIDSGSNG
ncbi:hypothetical protein containing Class III signal peptide motif [Thermococcus cleftensis]|uniref:Class III signal peptide-containing protein n=1 Tax=Thermococcus cleftensis (strain DSM 27260 / KACC 17922 / CL1) TaxID=163003 RepID=I3ZRQ1_THECF|nr:class III signal peptide-containing protein [Thermococcus cleftensis]AFL94385.1 hypothetical protein containing Class III signal peptide motif [Thermococcus cleftensis]